MYTEGKKVNKFFSIFSFLQFDEKYSRNIKIFVYFGTTVFILSKRFF